MIEINDFASIRDVSMTKLKSFEFDLLKIPDYFLDVSICELT